MPRHQLCLETDAGGRRLPGVPSSPAAPLSARTCFVRRLIPLPVAPASTSAFFDMPLGFSAIAGGSVAVGVGVWATYKWSTQQARDRLQRDTAALAVVADAHQHRSPTSVADFHKAARSFPLTEPGPWPSRAYAAQLQGLAARTRAAELHACRCRWRACGVPQHLSRSADALCGEAAAALDAFDRDARLVHELAAYAAEQAVPLSGYDVCERFFLDPPGWRQRVPASEAAMEGLARQRAGPNTLTPVLDLYTELRALVGDARAVAARLDALDAAPETGRLRQDIARQCDAHAAALDVVKQLPGLYTEREAEATRAEQRRVVAAAETQAAAAKTQAAEARRLRQAEEDRLRAVEKCTGALQRLTGALEARQGDRDCGLRAPGAVVECRNADDVEPIGLEPVRQFRPDQLCVLPSGNCMLREHVSQLPRPVDPYTNVPLPQSAQQGPDWRKVEVLIEAATNACRR